MFGQNDNQQSDPQAQTPDSNVLSATMPDPISPIQPPVGFNISPPATATPSEPVADFSAPELPATGTPDQVISNDNNSPQPPSGDLVDIKQQALQHLSPLVGHLDQTPEEKFRTTMMMIQASDNQDLIKEAFAAAQAISDDKARAQALLDVINEINYFTQHQN